MLLVGAMACEMMSVISFLSFFPRIYIATVFFEAALVFSRNSEEIDDNKDKLYNQQERRKARKLTGK